MIRSFSMFKFGRVQPPIRRVLALDAGSRRLKFLLAESDFGRVRILRAEVIDLQAEGVVSVEEAKTHLGTVLSDCGDPPLALVLPQHVSISQVLDLPASPESEVNKLIEAETLKLGGVSESRIVYDFFRIDSSAKNHQQFWVTLCQEGEIRERIAKLGIEHEDICEITTAANALIAAFRAASPKTSRAILVHVGAQTTIVVILLDGHGVFASSFQMGGDFFTRSLARIRNCTEDEAELAKQSANLLEGPDALPEFVGTIEGWVAELKRQLNDWFERNPALVTEVSTFRMIASGGATEQPGLIEYLDREAGLKLQPWPADQDPEAAQPSPGYEIAFGAVLQAFGASTQPVTLLPADYRQAWNRRLTRQRIEFASAALILICALLLAGGTWHKASLAHRKDAWLGKIRTAQEAVEANALLRAELLGNYEELRPMFVGQQNTLDTLKTLNLLELSRSNQSLWYVLVADQQTYFSQPPALTSTNKPARTNLLSSPGDRPVPIAGSATSSGPQPTEATPAKPGLIAELCVPESPEAARAVLSQVVNSLKQQQLFSKADLLSDDLRRSFADPKVVVPDRQYVLQLDFSETEFQQPFAPARLSSAATPRTPGKRGSPPPRPAQRPNGTTKQRPR